MNKDEYQKMVKEYSPKKTRLKNSIVSFFVGGLMGVMGQLTINILMNSFGMSAKTAGSWLCIGLIFVASLFTALGFFDNWVSKLQAGLIIPTTGFAHSITSAALDYKNDGYITGLGSNFFKLAGSVLLYGIITAFFFSILGVIIYG